MNRKTVSFLVSGRGSNFKAIAEMIQSGKIKASIGCVVSNNPNASALDIAREMNIPAYAVDAKKYFTRKSHEKEIDKILSRHQTDLVVAAGYMRLMTKYIIGRYRLRMINIHPALLPSFPGIHAQKQAVEYGVKISGCTVHFIDEGTDTGPIILQKAVAVLDEDSQASLAKRILDEEHALLGEAVRLICEDRLDVRGRKVTIK
jgi:phosphoribosylglycinamide formyltransferase 1